MPPHGRSLIGTPLHDSLFSSIHHSMIMDSFNSRHTGRRARNLFHSFSNVSEHHSITNGNLTSPDYSSGLAGVNLIMDQTLIKYMFVSMFCVLVMVFSMRIVQLISAHIRKIYCLDTNAQEQKYWSYDKNWWMPWLKREVIYAPLGKKRHNREVQLSKSHNYGTIPGRVHTFLLLMYVVSNLVYCAILPYKQQEAAKTIAELRGRSGILAVANMMPLILLAGRNNPLIQALKISFDTFNLFHRWIGRIVVLEGMIHVAAWYANYHARQSANEAVREFNTSKFLISGTIAIVGMMIIIIQSLSPVRHAFYEVFLASHQILGFAAILGVYVHLDVAHLPATPYIRFVIMAWIVERILRLFWIIYLNIGWKRREATKVIIEALPGAQGACRVTYQLPRQTIIRPGSHAYIYLPKFAAWQSHPFSIAWTNKESEPPTGPVFLDADDSGEKDSFLNKEVLDNAMSGAKNGLDSPNFLERQSIYKSYFTTNKTPPTSMAFICAAREGMTKKIYDAAVAAPNRTIRTTGFVEGPYAGHDDLGSYGTVIMFAGGAGITHHLVQIRHLIASAQSRSVATRRIVLAWSVRDLESLAWVQPWMDEILKMPGRRDILTMKLFVTKPRGKHDYISPSRSIDLRGGRCVPGEVLDDILTRPANDGGRVGACFVSVCGPGAFADEVRGAVRSRISYGAINMSEESFTW